MPSEAQEFLLGGFLKNQEGLVHTPTVLSDTKINLGIGRNLSNKPMTDQEINQITDSLEARGAPAQVIGERGEGLITGIDTPEAQILLRNDVADATNDVIDSLGKDVFDGLSPARQAALTSMAMNIGRGGLQGFTNMLSAIRVGDFPEAVKEFFDSQRAGNRPGGVPVASRRLAAEAFMLKHGRFPKDISGTTLIKEFQNSGFIQKRN